MFRRGGQAVLNLLVARLDALETLHADIREENDRLRAHLRRMAFGTMTSIVQRAIKEAASVIEELWDPDLGEFGSSCMAAMLLDIEGPTGAERVPAFTKLRRLHEQPERCPRCKELRVLQDLLGERGPRTCPVMRALLLTRDLVMLSIVDGHNDLAFAATLEKVYDKVGGLQDSGAGIRAVRRARHSHQQPRHVRSRYLCR